MDDALDANIAMPHAWDECGGITVLPWRNYDYAGAAGAIVSSVADMANWLILNLNGGRFKDRNILPEGTCKQLHMTQNPKIDVNQFPFEQVGESYAFGWRRTTYCNSTYLAHGGGMIGFPAYTAFLPDKGMGVVVLSNGSRAAREKMGQYKFALHKVITLGILDRLLRGGSIRDWNTEFRKMVTAVRQEIELKERELHLQRADAPPTLALHLYSGAYVDTQRYTRRVSIEVYGNALKLVFPGNGAYSGILQHWHFDVFRLRSSVGVAEVVDPQFVTFTVRASGEIIAMSAFGMCFMPISR
jgi:hypothetical protein